MGERARDCAPLTAGGKHAPMNQSPSVVGTPREWAIDLAVMTAVGAFLGVIGPFGTFYGGPIELRVAYWIGNSWIGLIVLSITVRLSLRLAIRADLPIWFAVAMGVAVGSVPLAVITDLLSAWAWPPSHGRLSPLFTQWAYVLAMAEPVSFAYYFVTDRGWRAASRQACAQPFADETPRQGGAGGGFLGRLPAHLGRDLLCLQMEDHFVRAHTARGSDLVLTPLKEAIAELRDIDGLQVHRSWWVARAAVREPVANGRNLFLRLSNGLEVPVSRVSVAKLRAAEWLGPPDDTP